MRRETHLQSCSVWRLEVDVVATPDGAADVDSLTIDNPLAVEPPPRAVHQLALLLPVKPLAGQLFMLVSPLGLAGGRVVQAVAVLGDKPGQLSSGAGRPGCGPRAQLWSHDETLRLAVLVPTHSVVVHSQIMSQLMGNNK